MPEGFRKKFEYYSDGLLKKEITSRGATEYRYNQWGRLEKVIRADKSELSINDIGSGTVANNYVGGNIGALQSIKAGLSNSITNAGKTVFFKVDSNGFVSKVQTPDGKITKLERNHRGQLTTLYRDFIENDPDIVSDDQWGSKAEFQYNTYGDLIANQDSKTGKTETRQFDDFGNVISETNARGFTSTATYSQSTGLLETKTDALNNKLKFTYYAGGLLDSVIDLNNQKTLLKKQYDNFGNLKIVQDALLNATEYETDIHRGVVKSVTDPSRRKTSYEYDDFNRIKAVVTAAGSRTEYSYWETGELRTIKDPNENFTEFEYDELGRLSLKKDGEYWISRKYNESGQVSSESDSRNQTKVYKYDDLDRLYEKVLPDDLIQFAYNSDGKPQSIENTKSRVSYNYDSAGTVRSVTVSGKGSYSYPNVDLKFTYDENGNRKTMIDPTGQTDYNYDELDRLESLLNPQGERYGFTFDHLNRLEAISRPGGGNRRIFDDGGFVTSLIHSNANGGIISSFSYLSDSTRNRKSLTSIYGTHNFSYDELGQLTAASHPEMRAGPYQSETFNYDTLYNRNQDQLGLYSFDSRAQRLKEDYRYHYFYDPMGNLVQKQAKGMTGEVVLFSYSSENQLIGIKYYIAQGFDPAQLWTPNGVLSKEVSYVYDALGRRIAEQFKNVYPSICL